LTRLNILFHNYHIMISIAGIKYQNELELLPYFNKNTASILIGKKGKNLDGKIARLTRSGYLLVLKKGLYVTNSFYEKTNKDSYSGYIANILRFPSYISLEWVLSREGIIPESVYITTSMTTKTSRVYTNFLGNFTYKNIKKDLFVGYREEKWEDKRFWLATRAKALFDFLYLKKLTNIRQDLHDFRFNWSNIAKKDLDEFEKYVSLAKSKKMMVVLQALKEARHVS